MSNKGDRFPRVPSGTNTNQNLNLIVISIKFVHTTSLMYSLFGVFTPEIPSSRWACYNVNTCQLSETFNNHRLQYLAHTIVAATFKVFDIVFLLWKPSLRQPPDITVCAHFVCLISKADSVSSVVKSVVHRWDDDKIIHIFESNPCLPGTDNKLVQISDKCVVKLGVSFESA